MKLTDRKKVVVYFFVAEMWRIMQEIWVMVFLGFVDFRRTITT